MKFLDEFRDPTAAEQLAREIRRRVTRPWRIMEICGGQTHAIVKFGLDELLPPEISLLHGPGCPVCVTPLEKINQALGLARRPGVILCSFGDMLRVPGSNGDLLAAKAAGADVRIVYSPLDAVRIAAQQPQREVVFFGVGFETTAPATALAVLQAVTQGLKNFSMLISHVLVPPAMEAILSSPNCRVQGFLAAGHVCTVMGIWEYPPIAARYRVPIVVTGFEPMDILHGILLCVTQLEEGRAEVENQYARSVQREGNLAAQDAIACAFQVTDRQWRGIGSIPRSGLRLRPEFAACDAEAKFGLGQQTVAEPAECRSGEVLQGFLKPHDCPAFGALCTPEHPLGATMVSSEGACAAYYRYRQRAACQQNRAGSV